MLILNEVKLFHCHNLDNNKEQKTTNKTPKSNSQFTIAPNFTSNQAALALNSIAKVQVNINKIAFKGTVSEKEVANSNRPFNRRANGLITVPLSLKEKQNKAINEAVKFIMSDEYYNKNISGKNWTDPEYKKRLEQLSKDESFLKERAHEILDGSVKKLGSFYKNKEIITIPWSGGKDSSGLLALSAVFYPEKEYNLLTVLNGMCSKIDNPKNQQTNILKDVDVNPMDVNIKHYYIDKVDDIKKHVLDTADKDCKKLGCSGICSSCKMVMEKSLADTAKKMGSDTVTLGYVKYQGIQEWVEQTPEQMHFLEKELKKRNVKAGSPLYDTIEYPFDAVLLLASMGIPLKDHKLEMKCSAEGLNPSNLDKNKLNKFLQYKNEETKDIYLDDNAIKEEITVKEEEEKMERLIPIIEEMREHTDIKKGSFVEV